MNFNKTEITHFRLSPDERAKVERAASLEGIRVSDLIRRALGHYLASLPHPPDGQAVPIIYTQKQEGNK